MNIEATIQLLLLTALLGFGLGVAVAALGALVYMRRHPEGRWDDI